jgi:hypothetical protein
MAMFHGKDSVFWVDNAAGTLVNLTTYLTNVDGLPGPAEVGETTTMGASSRTFIRGLEGGNDFTISGRYDSTATTGPDVILSAIRAQAATVTYEWGPEGGTTGKTKFTGEALCTNYVTSAPFDGIVMFSATFRRTGAVTKSTFV